jgi:hypothetical protein
MSETLADQLQRLCCAETESKFFDCVTEPWCDQISSCDWGIGIFRFFYAVWLS